MLLYSVFYFVLNMSITSSMIVVVLLIIRTFSSKYIPKSFIYPLWGIVLFRLLVPISVPSNFSIINLISGYITKTVAVPKVYQGMPDFSALNSVHAARGYFPLQYKSDAVETFIKMSGVVWITGGALFVIFSIVIYCLTSVQLKKAVLIKDDGILKECRRRLNIKRKVRLYESNLVASPVVFGIFKSRIIIPKDMPAQSLEFALLHELSHIKRLDNLWKILSVFAACLHWFNPFAWLFLYLSEQDMEFSCDENVLKGMEDDKRKPYANALLSLASKQQAALTAFGGTAVKKRIVSIVTYKRISIIMAATTTVICTVLAVVLLTNPLL